MAVMGGILLIFYLGGSSFLHSLSEMTGTILSMQYGSDPLHVSKIAILKGVQIVAPFFLMSVVMATVVTVSQGGFVYKPIKFEISKLNPIEGSKKIFTLSMGLIRTTDKRYQAPLQEDTNVQIVIIPSIKF